MKQLKVKKVYRNEKNVVLGLRAEEVNEAGRVHYIQVPAESFKHLTSQVEVNGHIQVDGTYGYRKYRNGDVTKDKHVGQNFKVLNVVSQFEDEFYDEVPLAKPVKKAPKRGSK